MERGDELNATDGALQQSRAKLRRELLPKEDPDRFPRSTVMRILTDPRRQQLVLMALSAAAMLVSRRHRARRGGELAARVREFTRTLGRGGWR